MKENFRFLTKEGLNDNIHLFIDIDWEQYQRDSFITTVYLPTYEHKYIISGQKTIIPLPTAMSEILNEIQGYVTIITILSDPTFQELNDFVALDEQGEIGTFRVIRKEWLSRTGEIKDKDIKEKTEELFKKFEKLSKIALLDVEKVEEQPCPVGVIIKKIIDNKVDVITAVLPELDFEPFVTEFKNLVNEV